MPPIRMNILNPTRNAHIPANFFSQEQLQNQVPLQGQFRGFRANRFSNMISQVVNSKPGCSSCGK